MKNKNWEKHVIEKETEHGDLEIQRTKNTLTVR